MTSGLRFDSHSDGVPDDKSWVAVGTEKNRRPDSGRRTIFRRFPSNSYFWVGVLFGGLYWILESMIHVYFFQEGTFKTQFFASDPHEIWKRVLVAGLLILFSLYAQHGINVRRRTELALATSEKKYRTLI